MRRRERDRLRQQDRILLDESVRQRVLELATDFPRLWNDPATPNREKKRMVRLLIEDVTLTRHGDHAHVGVRLRGGATRELDVSLQAAEHPAKLPTAIVTEIGELLCQHTDARDRGHPQSTWTNRKQRAAVQHQHGRACAPQTAPRYSATDATKEGNADNGGVRRTPIGQP